MIVLSVLLLVGGLAHLTLGMSARLQALRTIERISARAAADAGFTKALFEMNKNLNFGSWRFQDVTSTLERSLPACNADFTYVIDQLKGGSEYRITATGKSGQVEKTVSATLSFGGVFDYALFAQGYAVPKRPKGEKKLPKRVKPPKKGGKIEIKGYNLESYNSNPIVEASGDLQIRTNSKHKKALKFEEKIVIDADVILGPGAKVKDSMDIKKGAQFTGQAWAAAETTEYPEVVVPAQLENKKAGKDKDKKDDKKDKKDKGTKKISGIVKYDKLELENEVLEVTGNTTMYVEGDIKLTGTAELVIKDNASLTLYVGGKLESKKDKETKETGKIVNETRDATKLKIYGLDTCRKVKLEECGDFYGAVYAPYAKVEIKKSDDIYGALVGWDVKIETNKSIDKTREIHTFYYDEALLEGMKKGVDGIRFVVNTWSEP